jgi:hypothetical protein
MNPCYNARRITDMLSQCMASGTIYLFSLEPSNPSFDQVHPALCETFFREQEAYTRAEIEWHWHYLCYWQAQPKFLQLQRGWFPRINNQWLVIINGVGNTKHWRWIEIKATVRGWTKKKKTITSKNNPKRVWGIFLAATHDVLTSSTAVLARSKSAARQSQLNVSSSKVQRTVRQVAASSVPIVPLLQPADKQHQCWVPRSIDQLKWPLTVE